MSGLSSLYFNTGEDFDMLPDLVVPLLKRLPTDSFILNSKWRKFEMDPDNLGVHSFNKYLPSACYILGLPPVTESIVINKTGTVLILREPTELF